MTHGELAEQYFLEGYNCSQAVLLAFSDRTGLDKETAARLASSFGGGLARMREVCGAVSGAAMVLGLVRGYADPKDAEAIIIWFSGSRSCSGSGTGQSSAATCSAACR